ncbi:MAG: hypothetical protein OSA98_10765 [Rubripirellula sp.]|nr:hypothetical protein [Rubripirellula sp.]
MNKTSAVDARTQAVSLVSMVACSVCSNRDLGAKDAEKDWGKKQEYMTTKKPVLT